ncbi:MAG: zinc ribbon domain-containing protein [Blastocatellia bacterium]
MAITCPNCGAGNKEGSSVCRLCATSLEGPALAFYAQAPSTDGAASANRKLEKEATDTVAIEEIECPNCHTNNEAGWSFCQQCGNRLPQWSPPPPPPVSEQGAQEGFRTTPTEVPAVEQSYKTVVAEPAPKRPTEKPLPTAPTVLAEPPPPPPPPPRTPPPLPERDLQMGMQTVVAEPPVIAEQKPAVPPPSREAQMRTEIVESSAAKPGGNVCPQCGYSNGPGNSFCANCGATITVAKTMIYASPLAAPRGRLHLVMEGGQQGEAYELSDNTIIGRANGDITFPHDGFMSGKHARVERRGASFVLVDEGSRNGTFIRINGEVELKSGDMILIGKQLFRFEQ